MYLYGAGGHAKVVIDILEENNIKVEGIYDDNLISDYFKKYLLISSIESFENKEWFISIGNNISRNKIASSFSARWARVISNHSNLSKNIGVGQGTLIMKGVSVNADTIIGEHVILNTNCSIDHDCKINDFAHISPNVALSGNVIVGEGTHIGVGACVIPGVKIGRWVTIGAGAVIIRDIPDFSVVVGNPGKIIKYNKSINI